MKNQSDTLPSLSARVVRLFEQDIAVVNELRYGQIELKVRDGRLVMLEVHHSFNLEKGDFSRGQ